ncbi:protein RIK-like isoform X2 [Hibiscus syriacus]|uniref:protein RIK-like isoform X2 n=1 Tax=Hibiscus syriacus TaxID=106335 RepID=UPI0019228827|nr:protein RIK-like isoform X2 [Hibiscus syriacus]
MTEDGGSRVSSDDATISNDASKTRKRKKRKWDQPAEAFVSAGFAVPFSNIGTLAASGIAVTPFFQQHAAPVVSKQNQIQRCTGAVVITRGKYQPPIAPPDGEKPLYLHISATTHLKETAERIVAVDRAAAMVEELLKHGQSSQAGTSPFKEAVMKGVKAFSTCIFGL